MPITIGDFFSTAPHARPVNPRPVTFTAVSRAKVLPGGTQNQSGRPVAASITAAFVFLGGEGASQSRVDARLSLRRRFVDPDTKVPIYTDDADFDIELTYQILWRVLREYDQEQRTTGGALFPTVDLARELVEVPEASRIMREYNAYVADEHPEGVDRKSFRATEG